MSSSPGENPGTTPGERPTDSKRIMAGVLAIVLGSLGVHKFVLGLTTPGIIMLVVTIVLGAPTCGAGISVMALIGIIEGIIYLTKTDEEFHQIYEVEKKGWF
jgi:TM2 domain-containing membrane protein YozV